MKDVTHLIRLVAVFAVVLAVFLVGRQLLVPDTFGRWGHYRAAAIDDVAAAPVRHAGQETCFKCHADKREEKSRGRHQLLRCETCHGPRKQHAENPGGEKPPKLTDKEMRQFCARCHEYNLTRPKWLEQVDTARHNPGQACTDCHSPHHPEM